MENIQFENAKKYLCVICGEHIELSSVWICRRCFQQCEIDDFRIIEKIKDKMFLDIKSKCCDADVQSVGRLTCSDGCHEEFVKRLEREFGETKKVIDDITGTAYKVPTRDIIERGLTWQDLPKYQQWND